VIGETTERRDVLPKLLDPLDALARNGVDERRSLADSVIDNGIPNAKNERDYHLPRVRGL
jgi:hypothetical protein